MSFYAEVEHTARKEHVCNQCGQKINQGEKYLKIYIKDSDGFFEIKHHLICDKLVNVYCEKSGADECTVNKIDDWIRDMNCKKCHNFKKCQNNIYHCSKVHKHLISERIE